MHVSSDFLESPCVKHLAKSSLHTMSIVVKKITHFWNLLLVNCRVAEGMCTQKELILVGVRRVNSIVEFCGNLGSTQKCPLQKLLDTEDGSSEKSLWRECLDMETRVFWTLNVAHES